MSAQENSVGSRQSVASHPRTSAHKRIQIVFYALLALELLPVWWFHYFPSADGPSHLYNSYVFLAYSHVPIFRTAFTLHIPADGNLTGHALAVAFLWLGFPPQICQKLVVTICVVAMALAFQYAANGVRAASPLACFLVLPLLYNWPLRMGFWSFSLGVPFLLICIGITLRYNGNWNSKGLLLMFLSVAAVYACHPISWAVCGAAVAIMTVTSQWRGLVAGSDRSAALRQVTLPLLLFVPFIVPNLFLVSHNELIQWDPFKGIRNLLWPVYNLTPAHLFAGDSAVVKLLFGCFVGGSIAALWQRLRARTLEYSDVLLVVSAALFGIGLASPARIGEGTFLQIRMLLFGYLAWALWLGVALTGRALSLAAAVAVAMSLWLVGSRLPDWREANQALGEFVSQASVIKPDSFVFQLNFTDPAEPVPAMDHAVDLLSAYRIVDIRDYEGGRLAFWTQFRPGFFLDESYLEPAVPKDLSGAMERFEVRTGRPIDYIILTHTNAPGSATVRQLLPRVSGHYHLVAAAPPVVAIYKREF